MINLVIKIIGFLLSLTGVVFTILSFILFIPIMLDIKMADHIINRLFGKYAFVYLYLIAIILISIGETLRMS